MSYNINGFLGGNSGNLNLSTERPSTQSESAESTRVEEVIENKGYFSSLCTSIKQWMSGPSSNSLSITPPPAQPIVETAPLLSLPSEVLGLIVHCIGIDKMANFANACKTIHAASESALCDQAWFWGCKDLTQSKSYCKKAVTEFREIAPSLFNVYTTPFLFTAHQGLSLDDERLQEASFILNNLDFRTCLDILQSHALYHSRYDTLRPIILHFANQLSETQCVTIDNIPCMNTILGRAAIQGDIAIASFALKCGADPNSTPRLLYVNLWNTRSVSILQHAMANKSDKMPMTVFLLQNGADVNALTYAKFTKIIFGSGLRALKDFFE